MPVNRIDGLVMFTPGVKAIWNDIAVNVPTGVYVYDDAAQVIKIGNGNTTFAELPIWLDLKALTLTIDIDLTRLEDLTDMDVDKIVIVKNTANGIKYGTLSDYVNSYVDDNSGIPKNLTKLQDLKNALTIMQNVEAAQNSSLDTIENKTKHVGQLNTIENDRIVNIDDYLKISPNIKTFESNKNAVISNIVNLKGLRIFNIEFYLSTTIEDKYKVTTLNERSTYYLKVIASDLSNPNPLTYSLPICDNTNVTITSTDNPSVFKVEIGELVDDAISEFSVTVSSSFGSKFFKKSINIQGRYLSYNVSTNLLDLISFNCVKFDNNGDIVAVGSYRSNTNENSRGIIVKFNNELNNTDLIAKTFHSLSSDVEFIDLIIGKQNEYIILGKNNISYQCGNILILNDSLSTIISQHLLLITNVNYYPSSFMQDRNGNFIVVGKQVVTPNSDNIVLIKFDINTKILTKANYTFPRHCEVTKIIQDSAGKYIIIGYKEEIASLKKCGFILKADASLKIIKEQVYNMPSGFDIYFKDIYYLQSVNKFYISGNYVNISNSNSFAFVLSLSSDFNIFGIPIYTAEGTSFDTFSRFCIEKNNSLYLLKTNTSTLSTKIFKLTTNLTATSNLDLILIRELKFISSSVEMPLKLNFISNNDNSNDLLVCGSCRSNPNKGIVMRINPALPSGTFSSNVVEISTNTMSLIDLNTLSKNDTSSLYFGVDTYIPNINLTISSLNMLNLLYLNSFSEI